MDELYNLACRSNRRIFTNEPAWLPLTAMIGKRRGSERHEDNERGKSDHTCNEQSDRFLHDRPLWFVRTTRTGNELFETSKSLARLYIRREHEGKRLGETI